MLDKPHSSKLKNKTRLLSFSLKTSQTKCITDFNLRLDIMKLMEKNRENASMCRQRQEFPIGILVIQEIR